MNGEFEQIGTVEVLRDRIYPLDPMSEPGAFSTEVIVTKGSVFPVYTDGFSVVWLMEGTINVGRVHRMGDGMFAMRDGDMPSTLSVRFPSKTFGPDEWVELLLDATWTDGDPQQRMRYVPNAELVTS